MKPGINAHIGGVTITRMIVAENSDEAYERVATIAMPCISYHNLNPEHLTEFWEWMLGTEEGKKVNAAMLECNAKIAENLAAWGKQRGLSTKPK